MWLDFDPHRSGCRLYKIEIENLWGQAMLKEAILKVVSRQDLTEAEMTRAMETIMSGDRKSTRLNSSHSDRSRMPSSA